MARVDVSLGIILAVSLVAGIALAMGMGMGSNWQAPMMQGYEGSAPSYTDGYEGYGDHEHMMDVMGMAEHCDYGSYTPSDMVPFHGYDRGGIKTFNVSGVIVNVSDRFNAIQVETEDGERVWIKLMGTYIDVETGYLVSGVWLAETLEGMVANESHVNVVAAGSAKHRIALGLAIEIPDLGYNLSTPWYYDRTR